MFKVYVLYIFVASLGWIVGGYSTPFLVVMNDEYKIFRILFSLGLTSLAVSQAVSIKNRLGEIIATENLTKSERARLQDIAGMIELESILGVIIVLIGTISIFALTLFQDLADKNLTLSIFFALTGISFILFFRMWITIGGQVDNFKKTIVHRIEDDSRRKGKLDQLQ